MKELLALIVAVLFFVTAKYNLNAFNVKERWGLFWSLVLGVIGFLTGLWVHGTGY